MDLVGPLPRTKAEHKHNLVIIDYTTRWTEAFPLQDPCGTNFVSHLMQELYNLIGVKGIKTTPYHPETDGMMERFNSTLKTMLKKILELWIGQWDLALPHVLGEYRRAPLDTTGFTPSELLYG